jgi:hypothetical protein
MSRASFSGVACVQVPAVCCTQPLAPASWVSSPVAEDREKTETAWLERLAT